MECSSSTMCFKRVTSLDLGNGRKYHNQRDRHLNCELGLFWSQQIMELLESHRCWAPVAAAVILRTNKALIIKKNNVTSK